MGNFAILFFSLVLFLKKKKPFCNFFPLIASASFPSSHSQASALALAILRRLPVSALPPLPSPSKPFSQSHHLCPRQRLCPAENQTKQFYDRVIRQATSLFALSKQGKHKEKHTSV